MQGASTYERPGWAGGNDLPQGLPAHKLVNIDVGEFIRTRDALTSAYLGLSASLDRAVKAYLDHTQVVLRGDASLNISHLLQPFNVLTNHAQVAQLALQQQNGNLMPMMLNGAGVAGEEPEGKKKRKKRAYKQRDPNAPKRPLTAYFRFLGENRSSIAQEIQKNPELFADSGKPGDISRIATDRWKALTKEQQEPYRLAYQGALEEYNKEVEKYKAAGGKPEELDETKMEESMIEPVVAAGAEKAEEEDDDDEDEDEPDSDSDEEVVEPPPPPPLPVKSPKKSALKKSRVEPVAPVVSTIDPEPEVAASSVSPDRERKRKAGADAEGGGKKRSRKSAADREVIAAADPIPVPVPVAPMASSPEVEASGKKKKDKKKRKKGGEA